MNPHFQLGGDVAVSVLFKKDDWMTGSVNRKGDASHFYQ